MEQGPATKLDRHQILDLIAHISHETWMRQAHEYKERPLAGLPEDPFPDDRKRSADAWETLERTHPKTREEAVMLLTLRSHAMWLDFQEKKLQKTPEELQDFLNPNKHDEERAEDIVSALEAHGILSFK